MRLMERREQKEEEVYRISHHVLESNTSHPCSCLLFVSFHVPAVLLR